MLFKQFFQRILVWHCAEIAPQLLPMDAPRDENTWNPRIDGTGDVMVNRIPNVSNALFWQSKIADACLKVRNMRLSKVGDGTANLLVLLCNLTWRKKRKQDDESLISFGQLTLKLDLSMRTSFGRCSLTGHMSLCPIWFHHYEIWITADHRKITLAAFLQQWINLLKASIYKKTA